MALLSRVSRLFAADMHAVLDQIEEPDVVLRQAIREMEEELARQRQRCKWLKDEIGITTKRLDGFTEQSREIDSNLDICFANGNEALARKLTRRKLETARLAELTAAKREALAKQLAELEALLAGNTDQLDAMRQKAALLASNETAAASGDASGNRIDDDDVEIAFLREKQARASS